LIVNFFVLKAQSNIFSSFLFVVSMAVRMGGGPWEGEEGDKKRRKKREAWFCLLS